jgi:hypothetical protein
MWCEDTKLSTNLKRHCARLSETATSYCYDWLNVWLERNRQTRVANKLFGMNVEGITISSVAEDYNLMRSCIRKYWLHVSTHMSNIKAPYQQTIDSINKQVTI